MTRANRKRLASVCERIDAMLVAPAVEKAAFERFRETGELPEHQRLADAVVRRTLRGGVGPGMVRYSSAEDIRRLMLMTEHGPSSNQPKPTPYREVLFGEAAHGPKFISIPARLALRILVDMGRDVIDPEFIPTDSVIPDWGSIGWHLLGFFDRLVKPPYEEQASRLFDRFAELRARIDRDDQQWFEDLAEAGHRFLHEGELPDDALLCEAVLANGEFMGLVQHYVGHGDAEVMAAFDRAARTRGEARTAEVGRLRAMGAEGRLLLTDSAE